MSTSSKLSGHVSTEVLLKCYQRVAEQTVDYRNIAYSPMHFWGIIDDLMNQIKEMNLKNEEEEAEEKDIKSKLL